MDICAMSKFVSCEINSYIYIYKKNEIKIK